MILRLFYILIYVIFTSKGQFTKALAGEIDLFACHEFRHFLVWEIRSPTVQA